MKQLTAIVIGAGGRGKTYTDIMTNKPKKFRVVGVAEPIEDRREYIKEKHSVSPEHCFDTWEKILEIPKIADIAIISTMDQMHTEPAIKAMELGYDLLLEKPVAPTPEECALILKKAKEYGRKVMVCHVLRYTPFFMSVKKIIEDGILGDVISVEHTEAVGNKHQSHSFVRGNWGNQGKSSFMLLQKCCHDLDILQWLLNKECKKIQSFGSLTYFCSKNAPKGSPERCIDGCPSGDTCLYNAVKLYYDDKCNGWFRGAATAKTNPTDEDVMDALKNTLYGKCIYKCDNDVVDHQTVNMEFEDDITVTMTMCAFTKGGRKIHIMGTKGELNAVMGAPADKAFEFYNFQTGETEFLDVKLPILGDSIVNGHGGGDEGIIDALYSYMTGELSSKDVSEIGVSCKNHMLAFAAENARLSGTVVSLEDYIDKYMV